MVVLLPAARGLTEISEKGRGEPSFPAKGNLQNLLLELEKPRGLIPVALDVKKKFPEDLTPSGEEIARLAYGEYLIETGMADRAAEVLEKLIGTREKGPFIRMTREALQRAYYRSGQYQKSLDVFYLVSSDRKNPAGPEALLMAGNSYLMLNEFRPALETLSLVSPDRTHYPFALYSIGLAQSLTGGEGEDPVGTLRSLVRFNPGEDPTVSELLNRTRLTLGLLLKNQNHFTEALDHLGKIPPESPFYTEGLYGTGVMLAETGNCVKAIVVFEDLRDWSPVSSYGLEALFRIGTCFSHLKAFRNSVERFHKTLKQLQAEKLYLENLHSRIGNGESVPIPEIQSRFPEEDGFGRPYGGRTWLQRFNEVALLEKRVERIRATINEKGEKTSGEFQKLMDLMEKTREELESAYLVSLSGKISERRRWIEDLTQETTLQLARHIILIQDYETIP